MNVIKKYKKASQEMVEAFRQHDTATVHEAMGREGAVSASIKPLYSGMRVCGTAVTVKSHVGDNLMLQKALAVAGAGDVIVADMGENAEVGTWGEIMAWQAKVKGVAGLVTNGAIRDSYQINEMGFPVFTRAVSIKGAVKESIGMINHTISLGGVVVNPGDIILGDEDGVVVIPQEKVKEALDASNARIEKEEKIIARIKAGESMFEIMGFDQKLVAKGCTEETV